MDVIQWPDQLGALPPPPQLGDLSGVFEAWQAGGGTCRRPSPECLALVLATPPPAAASPPAAAAAISSSSFSFAPFVTTPFSLTFVGAAPALPKTPRAAPPQTPRAAPSAPLRAALPALPCVALLAPPPVFALAPAPSSRILRAIAAPTPKSQRATTSTATAAAAAAASPDGGAKSSAKVTGPATSLLTLFLTLPAPPYRQVLTLKAGNQAARRQAIAAKIVSGCCFDKRSQAAEASTPSSGLVHLFVDASNIIIGYYKTLANVLRAHKQGRFSPVPAFDFELLAWVMERGRPIVRAVVVGSVDPSHTQRPAFFDQAEQLGYRVEVHKRVPKEPAASPARPCLGHAAAQNKLPGARANSDEDGARAPSHTPHHPPHRTRRGPMREDRVDEAIQLKMSQSILDTVEPATIVLATGDGAAAETSDGFVKFCERAMRRGWRVELVSWSASLSSAWVKDAWRDQWGSQFRLIYLDPFVKDFIGNLQ